MMTETKLPSARSHDVTPHRPWRRLDTAIVLGLLATGIVLAVALGNDYGLSWDEPLIATYVERLYRAYASLESKDSVFVDLHFYGPAYFLIAEGISRALREVLSGWSLADGRHAAYFLSYLLGTLSVFVIAHGYNVYGTDIEFNFLNWVPDFLYPVDCIITYPPFCLKYKFIHKALEYDIPFAFLIPFDMCQKMARLFMNYGGQGLVPTSRIDYITPTGLSGATGHTSYYHSLWLTYKFNLPSHLTFVELTKQMKENI